MSGVATVPPPLTIRKQIENLVLNESASILKPEQKGAIVAVADATGVNMAVVAKTKFGFEVQGWFGKTWAGDTNVEVKVVKTW